MLYIKKALLQNIARGRSSVVPPHVLTLLTQNHLLSLYHSSKNALRVSLLRGRYRGATS